MLQWRKFSKRSGCKLTSPARTQMWQDEKSAVHDLDDDDDGDHDIMKAGIRSVMFQTQRVKHQASGERPERV